MDKPTSWKYQDVLHLSVSQWIEALKNPLIFNDDALRMVCIVFNQYQCKSTASDIARILSTPGLKIHYNRVCACNRKVARALYEKYNVEPPVDTDGKKRFWNIVFDGEPDSPLDANGHFYWKLRPNLIKAFENTCI